VAWRPDLARQGTEVGARQRGHGVLDSSEGMAAGARPAGLVAVKPARRAGVLAASSPVWERHPKLTGLGAASRARRRGLGGRRRCSSLSSLVCERRRAARRKNDENTG
jgi:hypothetical protein